MTLHVAVDFGTSSTCVAVSVDGREPQVVVVDGGSPVIPSAVYSATDGTLFVGQEAERHGAGRGRPRRGHGGRERGEPAVGHRTRSWPDRVRLPGAGHPRRSQFRWRRRRPVAAGTRRLDAVRGGPRDVAPADGGPGD